MPGWWRHQRGVQAVDVPAAEHPGVSSGVLRGHTAGPDQQVRARRGPPAPHWRGSTRECWSSANSASSVRQRGSADRRRRSAAPASSSNRAANSRSTADCSASRSHCAALAPDFGLVDCAVRSHWSKAHTVTGCERVRGSCGRVPVFSASGSAGSPHQRRIPHPERPRRRSCDAHPPPVDRNRLGPLLVSASGHDRVEAPRCRVDDGRVELEPARRSPGSSS